MSTSIRVQGLRMALVALAAVGAALLGLFMLASPAVSGTKDLTVTKTADTNDGSCSFDDCSLREAIIAANNVGVDNIIVPAGTYKLTIKGPDEDFAATGDLDIRRGVTIRGAGARNTIIDGNGIDRVFHTPFQTTPFIVSIFGVTITGGAPPNGSGGGISHEARDATLYLSDSTVSGNSADRAGGINSSTLGGSNTMTISRSTISGNKTSNTGQGGGIENDVATMTLENTTVSGNKSNIGGGIFQGGGTLKVADSTIASNTAQNNSGGISVGSTTDVKNSIVSNNKAKVDGKNCDQPVTTSEDSNLEKGTTCGFTQPTDVNADPKLAKLANNGGPTNTRALQKGSPAIDAGFNCPPPDTDQRGVTRPQDGDNNGTPVCDIGAYEKF